MRATNATSLFVYYVFKVEIIAKKKCVLKRACNAIKLRTEPNIHFKLFFIIFSQ